MPFGGLLTVGLITAGVGAGAGIYETNKAANTQQNATDQSLALQKQMYTQTRQDLSPYASIGTGALSNLRTLAGIPQPPPAFNPTAAGPIPMGASYVNPAGQRVAGLPPSTAQAGSLGAMSGQPAIASPAASQTGSGFVTVKAPTGETKQVPASESSYWASKGAQVV